MPNIPQTADQVKESLQKVTRRFSHDYLEAEIFLEIFGFYDDVPVYELNRSIDTAAFDTGISTLTKPRKRAIPTVFE